MKYKYLRAFIVLLAGLVTLIVNIKTHKDVNVSLLILIGVIIVFYIAATLIVEILQQYMSQAESDPENSNSEEEKEEGELEYTEDEDTLNYTFEEDEE